MLKDKNKEKTRKSVSCFPQCRDCVVKGLIGINPCMKEWSPVNHGPYSPTIIQNLLGLVLKI